MQPKAALLSAGFGLGLLSAIAVSHWLFGATAANGETSAVRQRQRQRQGELRALERQVESLAAQVRTIPVRAGVEGEPVADRPDDVDHAADHLTQRLPAPPDIQADLEAREFTKQQEHAAEPVDATWASKAKREFHEDLDGLGRAVGASVQSVDCRTSSCKVELAWSSHEQASRHYYALLSSPVRQNCAFFALLPEPSKDAKGYVQSVFFKCR
jgi:hypothetical protein